MTRLRSRATGRRSPVGKRRPARQLARQRPGLRILITAGPTREYLDPVRYLSNDSSGKMGFALAAEALLRGHRVTLVHGPVALPPPEGADCIAITSAADLLRACRRAWPRQDALIMAAAVADYTPAAPARTKRKKSATDLIVRLKPTPDVLATLSAARRDRQLVVGFALEDRRARARAADKLTRKNLDAIVLNRPAAIGADRSRVEWLVRGQAWLTLPPADKRTTARRLIRAIEALAARGHP
ncbi:MAG: phosphopantothenoylcysteine decarboxylase [Phycisphaerae bacterium]